MIIFSLLFSLILFLLLLGYSFKPSEAELALLPNKAFVYAGPDALHVLDIRNDGVLVNVSLRVGIDADLALGVNQRHRTEEEKEEAAAAGQRGNGVHWWEKLRRWVARQALLQLPEQVIEVMIPQPIAISPLGSILDHPSSLYRLTNLYRYH